MVLTKADRDAIAHAVRVYIDEGCLPRWGGYRPPPPRGIKHNITRLLHGIDVSFDGNARNGSNPAQRKRAVRARANWIWYCLTTSSLEIKTETDWANYMTTNMEVAMVLTLEADAWISNHYPAPESRLKEAGWIEVSKEAGA